MDVGQKWKETMNAWPAGMKRKGILIILSGESIAFDDFMTSPTMVLIQRQAPDATGARAMLLPYEQIASIKLLDVVADSAFESLGLTKPAPPKRPRQ